MWGCQVVTSCQLQLIEIFNVMIVSKGLLDSRLSV